MDTTSSAQQQVSISQEQQTLPTTHDTNNNALRQYLPSSSFDIRSVSSLDDEDNDDKPRLTSDAQTSTDLDDTQENRSTSSDSQSVDSTAATIDSTSEASMAVYTTILTPPMTTDTTVMNQTSSNRNSSTDNTLSSNSSSTFHGLSNGLNPSTVERSQQTQNQSRNCRYVLRVNVII